MIRSCLIDTNVLLRIGRRAGSLYPVAAEAVHALQVAGVPLFYTHQNIAEFWNVLTRPVNRNGFGLSLESAQSEVAEIEATMTLLAESRATYQHWRILLSSYGVRGVQVHDARLVATMRANGVEDLLTFNTRDFERFSDIRPVHPSEVLQQL